MSEYRDTLERELERLSSPRIPLDRLARRRDRKRRDQRIRAGVLGIAIAIAVGWLGISAIRSSELVPADEPTQTLTPAQLGIFADVRGWIAYGNDEGIWAVDPANPDGEQVLLSSNESARRGFPDEMPIAWSSDGSKLLIERGDPSPSIGPNDLVVLNADGTETLLVNGGMNDWFTGAAFTPDGSTIIYGVTTSPPGEDWRGGIYAVHLYGGSPRLLLAAGVREYSDGPYQTAIFSPTLSPDGSKIAYFEGMGDWGNSLWLMDADGTGRHQILGYEEEDQFSHVGGLQWSPDGTRLAFYTGSAEVYVVGADGSELSLIARGRAPYWSPDGSRIAYTVMDMPRFRTLATVQPDGKQDQDLGFGRSGPWNPLEPDLTSE
jgi:Tol biopolymer transport system component